MIKLSGAWVGLLVAAAALAACSSSSGGAAPGAVSECKRLAVVQCKKIYLCDSASQRADFTGIGTTEQECESAMINDCAGQSEPCGPDETFDGNQADKCITARDAQSCSDYLAESDVPACHTVCTESGAAGGPGVVSGGGDAGSNGDSGDVSGTDALSECKRAQLIDCQKIFACTSAADLASEADVFGTSVSECTSMLDAASPCSADSACSVGTTYHADQADTCVNGIDAFTCDQFLSSSTADPAACALVCQ